MSFSFNPTSSSSTTTSFNLGPTNTGGYITSNTSTTLPMDWSRVTAKTKYIELPETIRQQLDSFEINKKRQKQLAQEAVRKQDGLSLSELNKRTELLKRKLLSLTYNIDIEKVLVNQLKKQTLEELRNVENAQSNFSKFTSSSQPQHSYTSLYFQKTAVHLEERMQDLWKQIEDLSVTFTNIESTLPPSGTSMY
jgi:hypothetical protein